MGDLWRPQPPGSLKGRQKKKKGRERREKRKKTNKGKEKGKQDKDREVNRHDERDAFQVGGTAPFL